SGSIEPGRDDLGEFLPVLDGEKTARGGIELEDLEVTEVVAERFDQYREFATQGRIAHEAVVGVDRHAEAELIEEIEGVVDQFAPPLGDGAGLEVRRRAELERDLTVLDPLGERSERHEGAVPF